MSPTVKLVVAIATTVLLLIYAILIGLGSDERELKVITAVVCGLLALVLWAFALS